MASIRTTALVATLALCCVGVSSAEKVVFRDELTGCEMWRISKQAMFHEDRSSLGVHHAAGRPER